MKRESDEIRYHILSCVNDERCNIESIRSRINTGLPTMLKNSNNLQKMGFIKIHETKVGKRLYREIEITDDGKEYFKRLKRIYEK